MEENRNPFCIKGYLGRKWYFLYGVILSMINLFLQVVFCKDLLKAVMSASKASESYSLLQIFGVIPRSETITYLLIMFFSWIISFILMKKRFTDITGNENRSYLYSALLFIPSALVIFLNSDSLFYWLSIIATMIFGLFLLFKQGKYVLPKEQETAANENDTVPAEKVVSFWRRWGAYIIDTIIMTSVTVCISYLAPKFLYSIGNYSILTAFIVFMLYFGIMNSRINKGQTLGKLLCQVKVVDENGNYLSVGKSFLRAFIFTVAILLPMSFFLIFSSNTLPYISKAMISTVIFLTLINLTFKSLFLFNLKTRQTLHDLSVKSYVITTKNSRVLSDNKTNVTPIIFALITGLLAACFVSYLYNKIAPYYNSTFKKVNVNNQKIIVLTRKTMKSSKKNYNLPVTLTANVYDVYDKNLADSIGQNYMKSNPEDKIVYVILQRVINVGNTINKTYKAYRVQWKK